MTPKEKSEELVDKFYQTTPNEAWYNPPLASASMEYKAWVQAKQCALIAVDEILNINPFSFNDKIHLDKIKEYQNYWQEVKKAIEEL